METVYSGRVLAVMVLVLATFVQSVCRKSQVSRGEQIWDLQARVCYLAVHYSRLKHRESWVQLLRPIRSRRELWQVRYAARFATLSRSTGL